MPICYNKHISISFTSSSIQSSVCLSDKQYGQITKISCDQTLMKPKNMPLTKFSIWKTIYPDIEEKIDDPETFHFLEQALTVKSLNQLRPKIPDIKRSLLKEFTVSESFYKNYFCLLFDEEFYGSKIALILDKNSELRKIDFFQNDIEKDKYNDFKVVNFRFNKDFDEECENIFSKDYHSIDINCRIFPVDINKCIVNNNASEYILVSDNMITIIYIILYLNILLKNVFAFKTEKHKNFVVNAIYILYSIELRLKKNDSFLWRLYNPYHKQH